jgi:RNA-binding protein
MTTGPKRRSSEGSPARPPRTPRTSSTTADPPAAGKKRLSPSAKRRKERAAAEEAKVAAPATPLTGKAARYLRGLGHHLDPIVQIGKDGITAGVVEATRAALLAHELVKVKVLAEAPIERKQAGEALAAEAGAALAQTLGRTVLLYKRHPNKPKIVLPR